MSSSLSKTGLGYLNYLQSFLGPIALITIPLVLWLILRVLSYIKVRIYVKDVPTIHTIFDIYRSNLRTIIPDIPILWPTNKLHLRQQWKKYEIARSDLIAMTSFFDDKPVYLISSPQLVRQVSSAPALFLKPVELWVYQAANMFGQGIVATAGETWRRHRNVVKGCFGEAVLANTWECSEVAVQTMIDEEAILNDGVIQDFPAALIKITMIVIGQVGFGLDFPWNEVHETKEKMTLLQAVHGVESRFIEQALIPEWLMSLPFKRFRQLLEPRRRLRECLHEMIQAKRQEIQQMKDAAKQSGEGLKPPHQIFASIVYAQMDIEAEQAVNKGEKQAGLTSDEVVGNTFQFIIGGHETTGHTLAFTFGYLALYPEWQDRLYAEIIAVCGDETPTYRDMPRLTLCLGAALEALRLRDLVDFLPKLAAEDTVLPYTTWSETSEIEHKVHLIKKGSQVLIDSSSSQTNPFFWPDPYAYNPSRFSGKTPEEKDAVSEAKANLSGFSLGQRGCLGRRMAEVEMVAIIAFIVRQFKVRPLELYEGECWESMRDRLTDWEEQLTTTPGSWGLRFEARHLKG